MLPAKCTWLFLALATTVAIAAPPDSTDHSRISFPAKLEGGSNGTPSHLTGTIYVSPNRFEFDAFPQVEDIVYSCNQIKFVGRRGMGRQTVVVSSSMADYRFNLNSDQQANSFIAALTSTCKISSPGAGGTSTSNSDSP